MVLVSCAFPPVAQAAAQNPMPPRVGKSNHALTTPETQGTTKGAVGCEFLYDSGYLSLKFSLGFSACILIDKTNNITVASIWKKTKCESVNTTIFWKNKMYSYLFWGVLGS